MKNCMNYDILLLFIFAVLAVLYAFTQGFKMGKGVSEGKKFKPLKIELPTKENRDKKKEEIKDKIRKETAERLLQTEWENIDNYATSIPQRKVK